MKTISALFLIALSTLTYAQDNPSKQYTSWLPAPSAEDAMLLGNGEMGAMVYGHPHNELIILNHAKLYLPTGLPKQPINQAAKLDEIKALILKGEGEKAAKIPVEISMEEGYEKQIWSDPYIPGFNLKIKTTAGNIDEYQRNLNFETGVATVKWEQNNIKMERKQFISRADSIMVIQLNSSAPIDVTFTFDRHSVPWNIWGYINENIKNTRFYAKESTLFYESEFVHQWEGNIAGFKGVGKVFASNSEIKSDQNNVTVKNTRNVMCLIKINTYSTGKIISAESIVQELENKYKSFDTLLTAHKTLHSGLFNRVNLNLNANEEDKNLFSEVMVQKAKDNLNPAFIEKQFYAARYNIMSATGVNPPNLQGIWSFSWQPPWTSDYTHDGNLPVAISSFMSSNMPELMLPYFDYHDARIDYYRDNAKKLYGCRGIQIPSHTSSHGWNVHFDPVYCLTFWNGGAPWAAHYYYDYYLYTNDKQFLENRAYPFMKETALFFEDFVTIGEDGKYMFNPSYSPENHPGNNPSQATINATMDVMLTKELMRNLIEAGEILGEKKSQIKEWKAFLAKLPDYALDSTGTIKEWIWPEYIENHNHRHVSQLYGMFDMIDPEIKNNPHLIEGVEQALDKRMTIRREKNGGIMVFGLVQMAWVAANLGDSEMVEDILSWLSAQYWSNSLNTFHDPNGLFNIDLSGGFQTAVIKSLVYSEPGVLKVLPAKPASWETGSIGGIKARGQITIDNLSWNNNKVELAINSAIKQKINLELPKNTQSVTVNGKNQKLIQKDNKVYTHLTLSGTVNAEIILKTN